MKMKMRESTPLELANKHETTTTTTTSASGLAALPVSAKQTANKAKLYTKLYAKIGFHQQQPTAADDKQQQQQQHIEHPTC